jgi:hypothetical protein
MGNRKPRHEPLVQAWAFFSSLARVKFKSKGGEIMKNVLRFKVLLFITFLLCIAGAANADFVQNGDFSNQFIGWGTYPTNNSNPPEYVDTNSDAGNYQGQIGYSATAPNAITFAGQYTYTGRIFQNVSNSTLAEIASGLEDLTTGVYTINFDANLIDKDGTGGDADNFRFLAYTWDPNTSTYYEIANSGLIYGDGNVATGYLPYSYTLDLSGWDGITGDAYIAFLFNEEEGGSFDTEYFKVDNVTINAVPVPAGIWLFVTGLFGFVGFRKRIKS